MDIPLRSGMSIGVLLICVELIMMLFILLFVPKESAGACFVGFAIGESLGASALRICGGIFTKIADIGSDLMKIVFNIKEDDARNPGVIADCTGDNAGDSVGPTADGFETYGVTGVALISFIVLAVGMTHGRGRQPDARRRTAPKLQAKLIVWIFAMRVLMIVTSIFSYWINGVISRALYATKAHFDFEAPLTSLVWITSIVSIVVTYAVSYVLIGDMGPICGGSSRRSSAAELSLRRSSRSSPRSSPRPNPSTWLKSSLLPAKAAPRSRFFPVWSPVTSARSGRAWSWSA